jgi:two-component system, chemotaxis family, sensor kinase CheA
VTDEDAELLGIFLEEAREHLDGIEGDFLRLETEGTANPELVNKVFRAVHSVKGGASFFGLVAVRTLAHAMENILGSMQKGLVAPTREVIGVLLRAADTLVGMIHEPSTGVDCDVSGLVTELQAVDPRAVGAAPMAVAVETPPAVATPPTASSLAKPDPTPSAVQATPPAASPKPALVPSAVQESPTTKAARGTDSSIRVHTVILDRLMTLAGELVLTRNQLLESVSSGAAASQEATGRIDHITTELQDAIMSTRMQSIGTVFGKFRRVVRDLGNSLGKDVALVIEGEEVELDRSIVEAIGDPLTHLVRNALDHGIERSSDRLAKGKPAQGTLRLSALHKGGQVLIEIEDDGAGIDPVRVRAKAIEKGLCTPEQLAQMSESAIIKLIFRPGFSTATEVTEISGRGVGMDVVHSNLSRLGGVVDVRSTVGQGTLMRIKLPLTLAIIPCLLVEEEGENFAIPQASLSELCRIPARDVHHRIRRLGDQLVLRSRGELVPLVRLRDPLKIPTRTWADDDELRHPDHRDTGSERRQARSREEHDRRDGSDRRLGHRGAVNIAVVMAGDFRYGIMVETLKDSLEVVVKPLGRHLRTCESYAGATILGDGSLALILDVGSIGRHLQSTERVEDLSRARRAEEAAATSGDRMTLMLVENSGEERLAVPLGLIERIEQIGRWEIQCVGGKRTLTYRNRNLPLLMIEDVVSVGPCRAAERLYVVIYRSHEREVGLVVSELVDVVDSQSELDQLTHRQPGLFGSLLIDGRITLLLDVHAIARSCLGVPELSVPNPAHGKETVLVVEDSRFFRERLTVFCREAGYEVLVAEDGMQGLELLQQHPETVDLVLTDIEMPKMDGFELTRRVREDPRFAKLPVVAVTSLMGEEAELRGRQVGITEYMIKLDRDRVMERVRGLLDERRTARGRVA